MPKLAQKYDSRQYYADYADFGYSNAQIRQVRPVYRPENAPRPQLKVNKKKVKRNNFLHKVVSLAFFTFVAVCILPLGFHKVTLSMLHGSEYNNIKTDMHKLRFPTTDYLSNDLLFNQRYLTDAAAGKEAQMSPITEKNRMSALENDIKYVMSQYPAVQPAVYVWQYETENYADINADKIYSAASIIKVPVLIELFRSIEKSQVSLSDKMVLTDYYRAEGSGGLQYKAENSVWTLDSLARIMITDSDNSATNMIMAKLGSMTDINSAIRQWGLKSTYVQTWLPDMTGNNRTTARDMATMLYNIDNNDKFLNISSREKIFDYMGHVHNNRLIQAGLGSGALFLHKTGDIGKMLGDAGIVFAPNGTKYIVVILANRPHNSAQGKDFIVKASEVIYNHMVR